MLKNDIITIIKKNNCINPHLKTMKDDTMTRQFNYCISNPPYQNTSNSAIFHIFHNLSTYFSHDSIMIYPAQKWLLKSGKRKRIR